MNKLVTQLQPAKPERRHLIDGRAAEIISQAKPEPAITLLTTKQVAAWLQVSRQWLEIGRCKGWGPPCIEIGKQLIRYDRDEVVQWLKDRNHARRRRWEFASLNDSNG